MFSQEDTEHSDQELEDTDYIKARVEKARQTVQMESCLNTETYGTVASQGPIRAEPSMSIVYQFL